MEFREWLLKEDPNGVGLGSGDYDYCDYRDADAVPFIVYRGGYVRADGHDTSLTHVHMYLSSLRPDNPLAGSVAVVGRPPDVRGVDRSQDGLAGTGRLLLMPHMVLGRLWTAAYCWSDDDEGGNRGSRRRVISFWNPPAQVHALRNEILSMIEGLEMEDEYTPGAKGGLDDPREYVYEVEGNLMGYDEFVGGHGGASVPGWDPSKLHVMEPGPAKGFIKRGLGFSPSPSRGPDLATRMRSYTGD